MSDGEDQLREIKTGIFGGSRSPDQGFVQFFADVMRWPVDALMTRTKIDAGQFECHIVWLKGRAISFTSLEYVADKPVVSAMLHPLESVVRVEIGGRASEDNGFGRTVTRSITLHFAAGESLTVDPATFTEWMRREQVPLFIDAVLDAVAG